MVKEFWIITNAILCIANLIAAYRMYQTEQNGGYNLWLSGMMFGLMIMWILK